MEAADRLQARSLLLDEVYLRASRAEHERDQERKRAERHGRALRDLIADESETADVVWAVEAVLSGKPHG